MKPTLTIIALFFMASACGETASTQELENAKTAENSTGPILDPDWLTIFDNGDLHWEIDSNSLRKEEGRTTFRAKTSITAEPLESESDLIAEIDCSEQLFRRLQEYTFSSKDYLAGSEGPGEWSHIRGGTPLSSLYNYVCLGIYPD